MDPNSLPPMDVPNKSVNLWLVVVMVFITGLGAGVLVPAGFKYFGLSESKVASSKEGTTMRGPNGKLRRVDPPLSHEPTDEALPETGKTKLASHKKMESKRERMRKARAEKPKQQLAAASFPANETKKEEKKAEKAAPPVKEEAAPAPKAKAKVPAAQLARTQKAPAPAADLIEEVPSALTAVQVEKLMQNNSVTMAKNQKALARPVALPPSQNLNPSAPQGLAALPILKNDPRGESRTYPVSINNASFSKANLASCTKRCALLGMDAMGRPIKAIIDGATYASALMQHNGTINISGQPRIIKNQQILIVQNITFNLAPSQKSVAKRGRMPTGAPAAVNENSSGYTEVSFEGDDLKPGTVIKSRKQIPIDDQQDIPAP
jgi:hypothetical protein